MTDLAPEMAPPTSTTRIWARSGHLDTTGVHELYGFVHPRSWNGMIWWKPEFNVLVMSSDDCGLVAITSVDALYANEIYCLTLASLGEIEDLTVILGASHSHYTPSYADEFPVFAHNAKSHVEAAAAQLTALIREGIDQLRSGGGGAGSFREGRTTHTVSRRRRTGFTRRNDRFPLAWGRVMQPTHRHPTDSPVVAWSIEGATCPVVVWTFACHPTGFFDHNAWTSEFPGAVREHVRERLGEECIVIFLQGPSGDLRQPFTSCDPRRLGFLSWLLNINPKLLPSYYRPTEEQWTHWALLLGSRIVSSLINAGPSESLALRRPRHVSIDSSRIVSGKHPVDSLTIDAIQLAEHVTWVVTNAEVTSQLADEADLPSTTHLLTCANQCFGYLASRQEMVEGGYESCTWLTHFGCTGSVDKHAPDVFIESLARILGD